MPPVKVASVELVKLAIPPTVKLLTDIFGSPVSPVEVPATFAPAMVAVDGLYVRVLSANVSTLPVAADPRIKGS